jgi:hypothetical protein
MASPVFNMFCFLRVPGWLSKVPYNRFWKMEIAVAKFTVCRGTRYFAACFRSNEIAAGAVTEVHTPQLASGLAVP